MALDATTLASLLKQPKGKHLDGNGLNLFTNGSGRGSWRYQYLSPVTGKKNYASYGQCWVAPGAGNRPKVMGVSLEMARQAHQKVREQLEAKIDPADVRRAAKADLQGAEVARVAAKVVELSAARDAKMRKSLNKPPANCFADVAELYFDAMSVVIPETGLARFDTKTIQAGRKMVINHANPWFGLVHINDILKTDIAKMDIELRDVKRTPKALKKVRQHVAQILEWAANPRVNLRTSTVCPMYKDKNLYIHAAPTESHAALTEIDDIRQLAIAIDGPAQPDTRPANAQNLITAQYALRLILRTGQRSNNIYTAEKSEFDLDAALWSIPAHKMKGEKLKKIGQKPHLVFLSVQSVALLREQFARYPESNWVFPGMKAGCHMDKEKIRNGLKHFGFAGKHTPHGFRATMRTAGQEHAGLSPLILETMLAHEDAKKGANSGAAIEKLAADLRNMLDGGMGETYARETESMKAKFEQQSRQVAQGWSDWLEQLQRPKLTVVPTEPGQVGPWLVKMALAA